MLNFNNENWKNIDGFPGYLISESGKVYSCKRKHEKSQYQGKHYLCVALSHKGKGYTVNVHRLVAKAFVKNPDQKPEVNHINGDKLKNNACNLEWVTSSENSLHAIRTGLQKPTKPQLGKKLGTSSKYRNVLRDRGRWKARVKHNGKTITSKNFATELEAAIHVNETYKLHNITNRPLNVIK